MLTSRVKQRGSGRANVKLVSGIAANCPRSTVLVCCRWFSISVNQYQLYRPVGENIKIIEVCTSVLFTSPSMVRSSEEYNGVLLCVCPDVDLIKSCDPNNTMFASEDTLDREEVMEGCQVNNPLNYCLIWHLWQANLGNLFGGGGGAVCLHCYQNN